MRTEELIRALAADAQHRTPPIIYTLALALLLGALLTGIFFFFVIGVRPDFSEAMDTSRFPLKLLTMVFVVAIMADIFFHLARPTAEMRRWRILFAPAFMLASQMIAEALSVPSAQWWTKLVGTNALECLTLIPFLSIAPLACLLLALRQAAPARPEFAGAAAGALAGGVAACFYGMSCFDDSPFFVATWYSLAISMVVGAGFFAGRRWLQW